MTHRQGSPSSRHFRRHMRHHLLRPNLKFQQTLIFLHSDFASSLNFPHFSEFSTNPFLSIFRILSATGRIVQKLYLDPKSLYLELETNVFSV